MSQCPWTIRWTFGTDAQCEREEHLDGPVIINTRPDGRFSVEAAGDTEHRARVGPHSSLLSWQAGDRREYTGKYPGRCALKRGCTLHAGHHGRCAS